MKKIKIKKDDVENNEEVVNETIETNETPVKEEVKKKKRLKLEEQELTIEMFCSNYEKTRSTDNIYASAFKAWFNKNRIEKKLKSRAKLEEWKTLFKECMNTEVK